MGRGPSRSHHSESSQKGIMETPRSFLFTENEMYFLFFRNNQVSPSLFKFIPAMGIDEVNAEPDGPKGVRAHTTNRRNAIQGDDDLKTRILVVLKCIDEVGLDLPIFLDALSWGCDAVTGDSTARYQRSLLMNSAELPQIIGRWERRSKSAQPVLVTHAVDLVNRVVEKEMDAVVGHLRCTGEELTEENLSSVTEEEMASTLKPVAPTLWRVLKSTSQTSQQEKRNKSDRKKVRT